MGSVHFETLAQGRGSHEKFDYAPFSDPSVLSWLIKNRMKIDPAYIEKVYPSSDLCASGCPIFNENIETVFIDLEVLIANAHLTKKQRAVIELMMRGWTVTDISEETGMAKQTICTHFSRGLNSLIKFHNARWANVMKNKLK